MRDVAIEATDITSDKLLTDSFLARHFGFLISDIRDVRMIGVIIQISLVVIPFAVVLLTPALFSWWLVPVYWFVVFGVFLAPYLLMLHNIAHRPFAKRKYRLLNQYVIWVLGLFFGQTPGGYVAHHIGMHHPENNLRADLSSTMDYNRASFRGFAHYFLRFCLFVEIELARYLWQRGRKKLFWQIWRGELAFWALVAIVASYHWPSALVVFVVPFFVVRFLMMAGNWAQHAFIDPSRPANPYANSITCINCRYNRIAFNDGYHTSHHLKANRHWADHPTSYNQDRASYAAENALVFNGLDFFEVWLLLMTKQFRRLARHVVPIGHWDADEDTVIALLKRKLEPIPTHSALSPNEPSLSKA